MAKGRPREFDTDRALDAALMLFWRHGYEGTSMSALTDAMGINMPSLYSAFGNKEALFRKSLERYLQKKAIYLPTALKEPTARQAVRKLFEGAINLAMNPRHPDGCLLVHGALATGPLAEGVRHDLGVMRSKAERAIRERLEKAVAAGDLSAGSDPSGLAGYIITIVWGMSVQAAGGATRAQLRGIADMALRCLSL